MSWYFNEVSSFILLKYFKYKFTYKNSGVYLMVITGGIQVGNESLKKRDAIGISETAGFELMTSEKSELLLIEVPMQL